MNIKENWLEMGLVTGIIILAGFLLYQRSEVITTLNSKLTMEQQKKRTNAESIVNIDQQKRPRVTVATMVVNNFFSTAYTYSDQQSFDSRIEKAEALATNQSIQASELFEDDPHKMVQQLEQMSQVDEIRFFPKKVSDGNVIGSVLVKFSVNSEDKKPGQQTRAFNLTIDTDKKRITDVQPLGQFEVMSDSKQLEE
ncbi:hypothetical protein JK159_02285 [Weissella minor]|uniref:hypothetical protein n=1 Tax=Weissella minor TaxID=1620 RepID=UPI001BAE6353|nr:hypothetical protein [Weissella minor]MBS0949211.1 hypothetical protein [Weissella minor]